MLKEQSSFFEKVYRVVAQIPSGRVSTYGHIANYLGTRKSARMVGWAMNASHSASIQVPAHRVVNRKGVLTGKHHFVREDMMQKLLENEGLTVVEDQIIDFEKHLWDPMEALESLEE